MRIGIDAKWFYTGPPSGVVFVQNVIEGLLRIFPEHEYVLFMKSGDENKKFPFPAQNVTIKNYSCGNNFITNAFVLPWILPWQNLDIYISQNYSVPMINVNQVTIVFDIIYKTHPEYFTMQERMYFALIKPLLRFTDTIVTISEYAKNELIKNKFVREKQLLEVLYLGVGGAFIHATTISDTIIEKFRTKYNLPSKYILYVGRLNTRKNISNLLRGIASMSDLDIPLVLCGKKDWKMFDVEALILELGISRKVILIGHIPDDELPMLYRSASVFVFVSFVEGFGLPPLEAMASGAPVVVSSTSSMPEICGEVVEYVDPHDIKDIARGIKKVADNEQLRTTMIKNGKQHANEYTWENTTRKLMDIIYKQKIK